MNKYTFGDVVRLTGTFTDPASPTTLVDPASVVCKVQDPDGQTSTPPVTKDAAGKYHADFTPTAEGLHFYRFEGTAPWQGASPDGQFEVGSTVFAARAPRSQPPS